MPSLNETDQDFPSERFATAMRGGVSEERRLLVPINPLAELSTAENFEELCRELEGKLQRFKEFSADKIACVLADHAHPRLENISYLAVMIAEALEREI